MKKNELLSKSKAELIGMCHWLNVKFESDCLKSDLIELISKSPKLKEYNEGEAIESVDEFQGNEIESPQEIKETELIQECIEREITLTGKESVSELEKLIDNANLETIAAFEKQAAIAKAKENGVTINESTTLCAQEILDLIIEKQASDGRMVAMKAEQEQALKERLKEGVSLDYLQQINSHLIDATNQMVRQCEREKKSSERFYATVKKLEGFRREVFIR